MRKYLDYNIKGMGNGEIKKNFPHI